tara:strand:- start:484 stop:906 length:423 start_codon:yes stop_codon:yes gene_type:complete
MIKFILIFLLISMQSSFAFNYKISDQKELLNFLVANNVDPYQKYMLAISQSSGGFPKITQIECNQKNETCSKEAEKYWKTKKCTSSAHKVNYQTKMQNGSLKKQVLTFKHYTEEGYGRYDCKWYYNIYKTDWNGLNFKIK